MDANAFVDLIHRNAPLMHRVAYAYCRDVSDRADLLQEMAIQLWRCRDVYDGSSRESTWIYRIALNVAISFYRRERRHRRGRVSLEENAFAVTDSPEAALSPRAARLFASLDALKPLDKALVLLHLDGHDHRSIGEVLGLTPSNVGTKWSRIRKELRVRLDRDAGEDQEKPYGTR